MSVESFQALGSVGINQTANTNDQRMLALGKQSQALTSNLLARNYLGVKNGRVFHGGTAATGVAPGTAIGTTAAFTLYNPTGSGIDMVLLYTSMGYVSGTLGAGVIHYVANTNPQAAAVTGTAITTVNALLGGANGVGKAFTTATLPAAPTILRPFASLQASLATTAVQPWQIYDAVDGAIVIPQGCALSLEATAAAGTSPLVVFGATWEEVPA